MTIELLAANWIAAAIPHLSSDLREFIPQVRKGNETGAHTAFLVNTPRLFPVKSI